MKTIYIKTFMLVSIIILLNSCTKYSDEYNEIDGKWKLLEIDMGGESIDYGTSGHMQFYFFENKVRINADIYLLEAGTYEIEFKDNNSLLNNHLYLNIDSKDYQYENDGTTMTLWYHDNADGIHTIWCKYTLERL